MYSVTCDLSMTILFIVRKGMMYSVTCDLSMTILFIVRKGMMYSATCDLSMMILFIVRKGMMYSVTCDLSMMILFIISEDMMYSLTCDMSMMILSTVTLPRILLKNRVSNTVLQHINITYKHTVPISTIFFFLYLLNLLIAGSMSRRRPNRTLFAGGGLAWQ